MIGKIIDNKIVTPPINDGNKFNVNLDPVWLEANGFRELTAAEIEAANNAAKQSRTVFTQLQIREAFKALNKEADLNALLSGNPTFQTYWQEAQQIDLDHPVTAQALESFSEEEINAIKFKI